MKSFSELGGLVYSTEAGRMCPGCRQPIRQCRCAAQQTAAPAGDGVARVQRESKGRGGKVVTVVRGLALDAAELAATAKRLKSACGSGGTLKDGQIEIQGDHCDKVLAWLQQQGLKVKRVGG